MKRFLALLFGTGSRPEQSAACPVIDVDALAQRLADALLIKQEVRLGALFVESERRAAEDERKIADLITDNLTLREENLALARAVVSAANRSAKKRKPR